MGTENISNILSLLPNLLWFIFALIVLLVFNKELRELLFNVVWRVRSGASLKLATFELGESYVTATENLSKNKGPIEIHQDSGERYIERKQYYDANRNIFLVHRISPSEKPKQLYDILIYLIPHKDATLAGIQSVDYYFGRHWNHGIFTSIDRANGFPISTSAFGPFVCTAEIHFSDGTTEMLWRYIDFEMGAIGKFWK